MYDRSTRCRRAPARYHSRGQAGVLAAVALALMPGAFACTPSAADGPATITLTEVFADAAVEGTSPTESPEPVIWSFADGSAPGTVEDPALGVAPLHDVAGLEVQDGVLRGRTTGVAPVVHLPVAVDARLGDALHAVEIRMSASAGTELGLGWSTDADLDAERALENVDEPGWQLALVTPIVPGDEARTYTLSLNGTMIGRLPLSGVRHLLIAPSDVAGADFAIESIRIVSRREHLLGIPSGVSWQGLSEIYRETLVTRTPERVSFELTLPDDPWLDLRVGMIEPGPATFRVSAANGGDATELVRRTLTKEDRWEHLPVDLSGMTGRTITLTLEGSAERDGKLLYWGGPAVRSHGDGTRRSRPSDARAALDGTSAPPRGILFILADTLRRDRLPWHGGARDNAPHLARLAAEGSVFSQSVSQASWTKVSTPSILTSLYPSSHGIVSIPDRLPSSVTTLAEALREAGYATFATSSVPFTGKLSNLHQGIETLHEAGSFEANGYSGSKTARAYVDRLLPWLDEHAESPFFAFLHVFDPHSPFEPYAPYDTLYAADDEVAAHKERIEAVREHIDNDHMRGDAMPTAAELEAAGIDAETFVDTELDWYDASIRGMDAEIGRVLERLEQLGRADDTLIVFMSDHGEEFLEHGRHFHGNNAYGEMLNVPLMLWWPGVIPALRVDEVVESIDVYPTVLELAGVPVPGQAQGQTLLPLLASPQAPARLGWRSRPAFAERLTPEDDNAIPPEQQVDSYVIVADGWKLIRNTRRPEGWPEYELYDYLEDPLDQINQATEHPDVVERLAAELDTWLASALAARVEETSTNELSPAELERLRSLGYIQ